MVLKFSKNIKKGKSGKIFQKIVIRTLFCESTKIQFELKQLYYAQIKSLMQKQFLV